MTSPVRLATRADEPQILQYLHLMHSEGGMLPLSEARAKETFARAWDRRGGIIGVIGDYGDIRAMICLVFARSWYTDYDHLEEVFNWVHPNHRKPNLHYADDLIRFAAKTSDELSQDSMSRGGREIPLVIGVMTNSRMAGKVRLYRKILGYPSGAFFIHGAKWEQQPSGEDFWRAPFLRTRGGKRHRNGNGHAVTEG